MTRRRAASENPDAFTKTSILPKPPQSAILLMLSTMAPGAWNRGKRKLSGIGAGQGER